MTQQQFELIFDEITAKCHELLISKGHDYTDGEDRLSNFKEIARDTGVTPLQVWYVYFSKHISAIKTFMRSNKLESESIDSRFFDAINYLILGYALMKEMDNNKERSKN